MDPGPHERNEAGPMIATDTDAALRRLLEEGRARAALVDRHHALLLGDDNGAAA